MTSLRTSTLFIASATFVLPLASRDALAGAGRLPMYEMVELLELLSSNVHDAMGISPDGTTAVGLGATATTAVGVGWDTGTTDAFVAGEACCAFNVVHAVNDQGVGVGYTAIAFKVFRAILYVGGEAVDLNERVANRPSIGATEFLHFATGINGAGQIVGVFGGFASGEPVSPGRVFLLTPIAVTSADLNGDGAVDGADVGLLLAAWGGPRADLDGDGVTNGADLGALLSAWTG